MSPLAIKYIAEKYFPSEIEKFGSTEGMKLVNGIFCGKECHSVVHIRLSNFKSTRYYFDIDGEIMEIGVMLVGMIQYIIEDLIDMSCNEDVITSDILKRTVARDKDFNDLFTKVIVTNHMKDLMLF